MDRNIGVGFETQSHLPLLDSDDGDFDHAIKACRSPNHNRFLVFPRQDQHRVASIRVTDHRASRIGGAVKLPHQVDTKKADVVAHHLMVDHVGLLTDVPPGTARAALHLVFR
jgi:hypothetical protein